MWAGSISLYPACSVSFIIVQFREKTSLNSLWPYVQVQNFSKETCLYEPDFENSFSVEQLIRNYFHEGKQFKSNKEQGS